MSSINYYHLEKKGSQFLCIDDDAQVVICLEEPGKYIRVKYNFISLNSYRRLKLYWADDSMQFCEENSSELGFMNGEPYIKDFVIEGKPAIFFRIDCGTAGTQFEIHDLDVSHLTAEQITCLKRIENEKFYSNIWPYICNNKALLAKSLKAIRKYGFLGAFSELKRRVLKEQENGTVDKKSVQVVEPYEINIKYPLKANRKKVLHFIENFYTGGSSRLIIDIIENYGHEFDNKIFTMAYRGQEEFLNIDVEIVDVENKEKVLQMIRLYSPDIIHVHIWEGQWYHRVFDILDEVKNIKIVENINTPIAPILREYISQYIFVSRYVLETFHTPSDEKSIVVYPGSDFSMFQRTLGRDYLPHDTIGMVYRLGYDKLNQYSIDVFIKTVQKRPGTKAIIVGGGPQYDLYRNKVKTAGVEEFFIFTGYVPYKTLPEWYKKFTIFVAPVWQESFGQVSPFAMNMGIPVSGYNIGALGEILADETLLAEVNDSEHLSEILINLLNDYDRCIEIGKKNHLRAEKHFGVKSMVDQYYKIYTTLLS